MKSIKKIIAVVNDFSMIDIIIEKTFAFSQKYHAVVEILYVHERPLFGIPDFFHSGDDDLPLNKVKIKESILEKVNNFNFEKEPVVFVKIDDTPDRVLALAREDKETLIITPYHKDITEKVLNKISQPILIVKGHIKNYQKMALIVDVGTPSLSCIERAKSCFPKIDIELFYDYRYIVDPSMEADLQNIQIIEEAQREGFKKLKEESGLDGKFFIDGDFLGKQISDYLQEKNFDIIYACSHEDGFFVSDNLSNTILKDLSYDMLIVN
ncbi:hypothetical protein MNB_SV-3-841 [hydrothermal vent metagenome]|uniref:UspA domain-containing protein n=1 Tax=hydrothermal vent metagenome TaxID=652676 RepID=A0A1W1BTJ7_9ZZZZ